MESKGSLSTRGPVIGPHVEAKIFDRLLGGAPTQLEAPEPFLATRGATEVKRRDLTPCKFLNRMPQDQIVRPGGAGSARRRRRI